MGGEKRRRQDVQARDIRGLRCLDRRRDFLGSAHRVDNKIDTPSARRIFERTAALGLPAVYQWPEMAEAGGFAAYGTRFIEIFRQRARMVSKVLKGAKPTEVPVEQPTKFELVINLRSAKSIGHEIPAGLVLRADKLIE